MRQAQHELTVSPSLQIIPSSADSIKESGSFPSSSLCSVFTPKSSPSPDDFLSSKVLKSISPPWFLPQPPSPTPSPSSSLSDSVPSSLPSQARFPGRTSYIHSALQPGLLADRMKWKDEIVAPTSLPALTHATPLPAQLSSLLFKDGRHALPPSTPYTPDPPLFMPASSLDTHPSRPCATVTS